MAGLVAVLLDGVFARAVLPVAAAAASKLFVEGVGWRLDALACAGGVGCFEVFLAGEAALLGGIVELQVIMTTTNKLGRKMCWQCDRRLRLVNKGVAA